MTILTRTMMVATKAAVMQQDDVLSTVVSFLSLDDLPSVARTCKQWNRLSGIVCHEWMKNNCAALEKLVKYLPAESCNWKRVVQSRHQPPTVESSLNVQLQRDFDTLFRPAGIAAYSIEGTATHNLFDPRISSKKKGVYLFSLCIDDMDLDRCRYKSLPRSITIYYRDFQYLMENWGTESSLICAWCGVLGLDKSEYTINKPKNAHEFIVVEFQKLVELETAEYLDLHVFALLIAAVEARLDSADRQIRRLQDILYDY